MGQLFRYKSLLFLLSLNYNYDTAKNISPCNRGPCPLTPAPLRSPNFSENFDKYLPIQIFASTFDVSKIKKKIKWRCNYAFFRLVHKITNMNIARSRFGIHYWRMINIRNWFLLPNHSPSNHWKSANVANVRKEPHFHGLSIWTFCFRTGIIFSYFVTTNTAQQFYLDSEQSFMVRMVSTSLSVRVLNPLKNWSKVLDSFY